MAVVDNTIVTIALPVVLLGLRCVASQSGSSA
jgi:hypothetical protein